MICYRDWTLEQTAEHYLGQSLQRDGYADATVKVSRDGDSLSASFSGVPNDYGAPLTSLLNAGDLAFDGASKLNGDGKWQYSWYFFLPWAWPRQPQERRTAALPAGLLADPGP